MFSRHNGSRHNAVVGSQYTGGRSLQQTSVEPVSQLESHIPLNTHGSSLACMFSPDGNTLATASQRGVLAFGCPLYYASSDAVQLHHDLIFDVCWGGNGNANGWYDVKQGAITADFVGHEGSVKCVNVNVLNPFVIASGGRDGAVCIWDSRTAQVHTRSRDIPGFGTIKIGQTPSGMHHRPVATYAAAHVDRVTGYSHSTTAVALLNDGYTLLSGGADGDIHRWDLRAKSHAKQRPPTQVAARLPKGQSPRGITSFSLDSTSNNLVVGSIDDAAYLYRGVGSHQGLERPPEVLRGHTTGAFYYKAALSSDAEYVVSGSSDSAAYIWKVHPTRNSTQPVVPWVLDNPEGRVFSVACHAHAGEKSGNGHPTVAATSQTSVRLWSAMSRARAMQGHGPRDEYKRAFAAGFAGRHAALTPRRLKAVLPASTTTAVETTVEAATATVRLGNSGTPGATTIPAATATATATAPAPAPPTTTTAAAAATTTATTTSASASAMAATTAMSARERRGAVQAANEMDDANTTASYDDRSARSTIPPATQIPTLIPTTAATAATAAAARTPLTSTHGVANTFPISLATHNPTANTSSSTAANSVQTAAAAAAAAATAARMLRRIDDGGGAAAVAVQCGLTEIGAVAVTVAGTAKARKVGGKYPTSPTTLSRPLEAAEMTPERPLKRSRGAKTGTGGVDLRSRTSGPASRTSRSSQNDPTDPATQRTLLEYYTRA